MGLQNGEKTFLGNTMGSSYVSTRRHNPEQHRHPDRGENLKTYKIYFKDLEVILAYYSCICVEKLRKNHTGL
jgi:hypothetical protein